MRRVHAFVILSLVALVGGTVGCYRCAFADCRDRPLPPEPSFVETRARDAGPRNTRP